MSRGSQAVTRMHRAASVLLAVMIGSAHALAQPPQPLSDAPPLPRIAAETFPEPSRDAITEALRAARARPGDESVVGALGMLLQAWEQWDGAAEAYRRAQALAPDKADWWYLGGLTDTARAMPDSAARQFARASALAPDHAALVSGRLADARLAAGADDEAEALYRTLLVEPAHAAAAWYGIGRLALRRGDETSARTALQKATALHPEFGAAHYALAQAHRRAGDTEAAAVALALQQRCPACGPWPDDPWQARIAGLRDDAFARLTRGIAAASANTTAVSPDAIRLHEAAVDQPETRGQAHLNLIELYGRAGDTARAKQHYLAALDQAGFATDADRTYAAVLLEQQQVDEALALFIRATTRAPRDAVAWQGRGLALERLGRVAEAAEAYGTALQLGPDDHQSRFALARLSMRAGLVDQAIAYLEELRTLRHAETPRYLFALSTAYLRRGRHDDALRTATDALTLARQLGDHRMATFIDTEMRKLGPPP